MQNQHEITTKQAVNTVILHTPEQTSIDGYYRAMYYNMISNSGMQVNYVVARNNDKLSRNKGCVSSEY